MRLLFLESRVRGEAAARQPRNSKQALAMRQKLIEFPAQIPPFLEREGAALTAFNDPGRCPGLLSCGAFSAAPGVLPYINR
jgi:hypothetical protein